MSKALGIEEEIASAHVSVLDAPIPESEKLPDVDESIKKRLHAIKDTNDLDSASRNKETSQGSLDERLANLKGTEYKEYDHKEIIHAKDKRSEQEKINDLIKQYAEENEIDELSRGARGSGADGDADGDEDPIKSIEKRLAALKGSPSTSDKPKSSENEQPVDEPTIVKNIVKQVNWRILTPTISQNSSNYFLTLRQ